jgi:hypothetical protein
MTITRIIGIGIVTMFALAIGIATFDPTYAAMDQAPCCAVRNGVWVVTKTGKPATAAQLRTMHAIPCCGMRNGVYVNLKTGQPVTAPTAHEAASPKSGGQAGGGSDPGGSMGHHGK